MSKFHGLHIPPLKFDINLKFYFWLKHLLKTKLTDNQAVQLLGILLANYPSLEVMLAHIAKFSEAIKGTTKLEAYNILIVNIQSELDVQGFTLSLHLYMIKDLLLQEAKLKEISNQHELSRLDPLSLSYDHKSLNAPYSTRVNAALLSLLFFERLEKGETNFVSADTQKLLQGLAQDLSQLKQAGLEPNQIFMLMFSESINQSIISDSGSNFEDRIFNALIKLGIPESDITKTHDNDDKSTEFDFFFELDGISYGIGAKRTLRERYKKFIKTAVTSKIDVMIEITLGLDLNEEKAKTIVAHGTKIFVADEVYEARDFLKKIDGVFSLKDFTLETFRQLKNKN